jgi:hypothetical protein
MSRRSLLDNEVGRTSHRNHYWKLDYEDIEATALLLLLILLGVGKSVASEGPSFFYGQGYQT